MTTRRSFLAALIATAALDPERMLWVTGEKTISIPRPSVPFDFRERLAIAYLQEGHILYELHTDREYLEGIRWYTAVSLAPLHERPPERAHAAYNEALQRLMSTL